MINSGNYNYNYAHSFFKKDFLGKSLTERAELEGLDSVAWFPGDENRQSLEQRGKHFCVWHTNLFIQLFSSWIIGIKQKLKHTNLFIQLF